MQLVLSTGTNIGNRQHNLELAFQELSKKFKFIERSRIYSSAAVDYLDQPDFLNQVLCFELPDEEPSLVMNDILELEAKMGRIRNIDKGPRTIDIDILFWGVETLNLSNLVTPHPRLFERSFIVLPLMELSVFSELEQVFNFPKDFQNSAYPLEL